MNTVPLACRAVRALSRIRYGCIGLSLLAMTTALPAHAGTWDHAHGNATNSGYADVRTLPAQRPDVLVGSIGTYASGAGPVIAPNGDIVLGSQEGELRALTWNGALHWRSRLDPGYAILASPVVDVEGSVYVVGEKTYRDRRITPSVLRTDTAVFRFAADGRRIWMRQLPEFYSNTRAANRGATSAPLNVWRFGGDSAVMVPVVYKALGGGSQMQLLALATATGNVLHNQLVTFKEVGALTSSDGWITGSIYRCLITFCWAPGFEVSVTPLPADDRLPEGLPLPMAGVAIGSLPGSMSPVVVVNDPWMATVGYAYSSAAGFSQLFRKTDKKRGYAATPMLLPDGHSVSAVTGDGFSRLTFAGPASEAWPDLVSTGVGGLVSTPARTSDQRLIATGSSGGLLVAQGSTVLQTIYLASETIAPPAVSRTHVFVSTASSLRTYNATTLAEVARVPWYRGGQSSPAIGAAGRVYALANNVLFGWPAPKPCLTILCSGGVPPVIRAR